MSLRNIVLIVVWLNDEAPSPGMLFVFVVNKSFRSSGGLSFIIVVSAIKKCVNKDDAIMF